MSMTACPELASLETVPLPPEVRDHVATCPSCKLVADVFAEGDTKPEDCGRFDALLAARSDGTLNAAGKNLLDRHLASCESCRAVSETLESRRASLRCYDEPGAVCPALPGTGPGCT